MKNTKTLSALVEQLSPQAIEWYKLLHSNPEASFNEHQTKSLISKILDSYDIPHITTATTGLIATIKGQKNRTNDYILLRSDIDALQIQEATGLDYASTNGYMHACGHDVHTASLLLALISLSKISHELSVDIVGLFQPGEETIPGGASIVLAEGHFDAHAPLYVISQHCSPEIVVGKFGFHSGDAMASSDELHITIKGQGGHAAMPDSLKDPVVASAAVIMALQQVISRNVPVLSPALLSIGRVEALGATNVIPDKVMMLGTLRTMNQPLREALHRRIIEIVQYTAAAWGCSAVIDIRSGYPGVVNDPKLTQRAVSVCEKIYGVDSAIQVPKRMGTDDFGYFSQRFPSLLYRLGVGGVEGVSSPALHTNGFCADPKAILFGANMLTNLVADLEEA